MPSKYATMSNVRYELKMPYDIMGASGVLPSLIAFRSSDFNILPVSMVPSLGKCPVDEAQLDIVVANLAVAEQIGELYVYCRYGTQPSRDGFPFEVSPSGCPLNIRISAKRYIVLPLVTLL